jgi:hypothetical protein
MLKWCMRGTVSTSVEQRPSSEADGYPAVTGRVSAAGNLEQVLNRWPETVEWPWNWWRMKCVWIGRQFIGFFLMILERGGSAHSVLHRWAQGARSCNLWRLQTAAHLVHRTSRRKLKIWERGQQEVLINFTLLTPSICLTDELNWVALGAFSDFLCKF